MNLDSISAVITIVFVWRSRGERLNPAFVLQRHTALTAGVMVWGAIDDNTRSPLVLIRGPMTAQRYVYDILQTHVLPLMQRPSEAIFQQDNVQPHTARVSQDCLRTVTTLPWPARSPDLSPTKHIWDHLGRRVGHSTSLNELEARFQQIWNEMSQDIIQNVRIYCLHLATGRTRHTIQREGPGNERRERVGTREKRKAVAKKRWSEKEDTAGRCIVIW
ncbi:transposable element Tcb2 transposase [Trichonephila clavipes]|nr:transposable element Tcb2 transposase [Trichonephila clavipes]